MMFTRTDWLAMGVGWALGGVVAVAVMEFNVSLWAALPILFVCTFLATMAMIPR